MTANLLGPGVEGVVGDLVDDSADVLLVVNPTAAVVEAVVEAASASEDAPTVRVLAASDTLRDVMDDFLVAGAAADLDEDGVLSLRTGEDLPQGSLLVTPSRLVSLVTVGDAVGGVVTDDDAFVDRAFDAYEDAWSHAAEFSLRTPPLSSVRASLGDDIGEDVEADFDEMLASMETARGDGDGLDEVTLSLLAAARNRVLLYDISKWGEDVGIASKATFSRTKSRLEELGLVDTEKVPIDVGRPRLRLTLAEPELRDASPSELASVAQSVLAS